jgi:hypothetical protein
MADINELNPADWPRFPPTDESGDVDLWMLEHNRSLTPAQRLRAHAAALALVRALERARDNRLGRSSADSQTSR